MPCAKALGKEGEKVTGKSTAQFSETMRQVVACQPKQWQWPFTRGSSRRLWEGGRLWEAVARGGSTVGRSTFGKSNVSLMKLCSIFFY